MFILFNTIKTLGFYCLACGIDGWFNPQSNPNIILHSLSFHSCATMSDAFNDVLVLLDGDMAEPNDEVNFSFMNNNSVSRKAYSFKTKNLHTS